MPQYPLGPKPDIVAPDFRDAAEQILSRDFAPLMPAGGAQPIVSSRSITHAVVLAGVAFAALMLGEHQAHAQGRDRLLNGTIIGAAVGAGMGVAITHALRDSDLVFSQYARGALVFGAIGAGVGLGVDALLDRASPGPGLAPPRVSIVPAVWRDIAGVVVTWRW